MGLRAVEPDETAPAIKKMSILEAVEAGDRLAELYAVHVRVAKAVMDDNTPARDLAALTRRQMEISKEIEALRRQVKEERADASNLDDEAFDAAAV